jgi:hypothetical protein
VIGTAACFGGAVAGVVALFAARGYRMFALNGDRLEACFGVVADKPWKDDVFIHPTRAPGPPRRGVQGPHGGVGGRGRRVGLAVRQFRALAAGSEADLRACADLLNGKPLAALLEDIGRMTWNP